MTPFSLPAYRQLWFSTLASAGAMGMERTATAWVALQIGATPVEIGGIFAARMLPSLLFGLAAGTIADRSDRTRQLMAVGGGSLLLMALFGWLVGVGNVLVWHVTLFSFAAGCIHVFDTPARQALVLDTASKETAMRALSLNALAGRFSAALGAFAAGALIPSIGVAYSYLVVALIYAVMAALTATLRVAQEHHTSAEPPPFREALWGAVRLIIDLPVVRLLVIAGLVCEICAFSHMSALPLFAKDVLATSAEGLGALNAALSIGGAIAVALLSLLPERLPRQPLLGATFLIYGLSIIALAGTRDLITAAAVLVIIGCCAGAFDVLQQTLLQMAVPVEQRGRAVGIWVLSIGSAPLGHLEMGALVAALGVPIALFINGAVTVVSALTLLVREPEYRWKHFQEQRTKNREQKFL